ncbi:uncharacterized protein [Coffea arabica]|uniref:Reverse transcriptase domain-containing protein n=1 Tax=Coffea arabica TaxID=13443 RepID=A0ABM4VGT8_COFAR
MSTHPESSDRPVTTSSTDLANLRAQLSEMLNKFNKLSEEMTTQRHMIDQLVANSGNVPEETFTYLASIFPYTYPHNIQVNPVSIQIPQNCPAPQVPHDTTEPFMLDAAQEKVKTGESSAPIDKNLLKRLDLFDEFIRKSQGLSKQGGLDYNELCLFPNMQWLLGFKIPKFNKYNGIGNPKTHLRLFANKLEKPVDDENLLIHLFPESLEGDALDWYSNLKPKK